jgi:hypothetical protein
VQENPLSFSGRSSTSSNGTDSQVQSAQLGGVVRLIGTEHGKQSMEKFPHDRHDSLHPSFTAN